MGLDGQMQTQWVTLQKKFEFRELKSFIVAVTCLHFALEGVTLSSRAFYSTNIFKYIVQVIGSHYPTHSEVKVAQSCPTLCDPMDYTAHGILQARILEWVAFPFSRGSSRPRDQTQVSRIAGIFFAS